VEGDEVRPRGELKSSEILFGDVFNRIVMSYVLQLLSFKRLALAA
jgi:hypothetical protein